MHTLTRALIDYWHRLPATPPRERRESLERTVHRVRMGELPPQALVPYVLADTDEEIVAGAVAHYLDVPRASGGAADPAVDDTLEWVRRGLALNRGAVFSAILARSDPALNERLAALRLSLSADEVATVSRRAAGRPCTHSRRFLRDWLELLAGDGARREREHLAGALGAQPAVHPA